MTLAKTQVDGYVKDFNTGAVLSNDRAAFRAYLENKNHKNRVAQIEEDVSCIKDELNEIRSLLLQIANR